jgi:hypothetical protein
MARTLQVVASVALATVLSGRLTAQGSNAAVSPYKTSLIATVIPVALGVAVAGTGSDLDGRLVAGYVVATLGASIGPAAGHWRLGQDTRGWVGAAGRLFLTWGSVAAAAAVIPECYLWACLDQLGTGYTLMLLGHGASAVWAVSDIVSLRGVESPQPVKEPMVDVRPVYMRATQGVGVGIRVRF